MAITAALVKELRERTGAGMMECKKMLTETDGDIELAIEELRKRGAAQTAFLRRWSPELWTRAHGELPDVA